MTRTNAPKHAASRTRRSRLSTSVAAIGLSAIAVPGIVAASSSASVSGMDIKSAIRHCESGGSYTVVNSIGAAGAYQFLPSTWHGLGYSGTASQASPATQDAAFDKLYAQAGTSPWVSSKACWSKLVGSNASFPTTTSSRASSSHATHVQAPAQMRAATTTPTSTFARSSQIAQPTQHGTNITTSQQTPQATQTLSTAPALRGAVDPAIAHVTLTPTEQELMDAATAVQKQQEWWTPQAANGSTIIRHVVANNDITLVTHTAASFTSVQADVVHTGDRLVGHYVTTDWFKVTSGPHTGQFISTSALARDVSAHRNGDLNLTTLAGIPSELRAATAAQAVRLDAGTVKSLITMNAAYRAATGHNLSVTEGYQNASEQGVALHGLGLSMDLRSNADVNTMTARWLTAHASAFGFDSQDVTPATTTWHIEHAG